MTDFVPDPRDRLEAPICKAIESKDFKQALKLVEKRLAKSSDSYLQACNQLFVFYALLRQIFCHGVHARGPTWPIIPIEHDIP